MRQILIDANVFISFLVDRSEKHRARARVLLESAADGVLTGIVAQFAMVRKMRLLGVESYW